MLPGSHCVWSGQNSQRLTLSRPFLIQRQQLLEDLLVAHLGLPAVGGEDGGVELGVGEGEPGGALVVEVRQGALLELRGARVVAGARRR